ncbi:Csu type fimbrial protein [Pseudomonas chlororaphis]|jgi:spore coat protein U-like protein|uniref:Csu type fimbrial protein n=1 Tax=Pseudomonas chlororaphis TaxID=587753 RepID=UPI00026E40B6|nr:spore coat U domain-containing protein [Pseudomonas chlororaphis]EJL06531.1 putative type I pilus protein CsuA/B [Pseudomonas chlororaphis subsp. aureofaciens 30-84]MCP1477952.1 spore coat protein U-like protein [Pseudomonas chlororaphis]MCP1595695.1 spore coat protein U-like protein [Pseudomonas chlororaphis]WDG52534.1 spore coat U domain-containing protein [Pseudomonas chlororaphis]WDH86449.1 spore coat U domain-containing protein [Pseudomonas chlororaphis]
MTSRRWALAALGSLLLLADHAQAAISGQIHARLTIIAGCEVTNGATRTPENPVDDLGLLDFGQHGPTWSAPLRANVSGSGSGRLEVACNPSVTGFTVTIDGGRNGDGSTRRLSNGRQTIAYRLFLDASGSDSYSIGQQRNFAVTSGAQVPIPVFGSVVANSRALPAGVYTDTLTVTLDW